VGSRQETATARALEAVALAVSVRDPEPSVGLGNGANSTGGADGEVPSDNYNGGLVALRAVIERLNTEHVSCRGAENEEHP